MTTPAPLPGHDGPVLGMSWSYDSHYLLSCSADKTARVWAMGGDHPMKHRTILNFATMTHNFKEESGLATKVRDCYAFFFGLILLFDASYNYLLGIITGQPAVLKGSNSGKVLLLGQICVTGHREQT